MEYMFLLLSKKTSFMLYIWQNGLMKSLIISDVIIGAMASQSSASRLFTQPFIRDQIEENIKA